MKKINPIPPKKPKFSATWLFIVIIGILAYMMYTGAFGNFSADKEVPYTTFKKYVEDGYAKSITVDKNNGTAKMVVDAKNIQDVFKQTAKQTGNGPTVTTKVPSVDKVADFLGEIKYTGTVEYTSSNTLLQNIFWNIFTVLLLIGGYFWIMRKMSGGGGGAGGGIFSVGKSKARLFDKGEGVNVTFKDVAGQEGAKQEVQEIVDFLKNPGRYTELGGKIPKGALLVGPPGTGKTLLAKAVAGEADVPFFSMSGSDFVEMFVGVGASRVRDLFKNAKEKAPSIVFIDEIDAVGRARGKNANLGGNDERENTLNQLLTEMDGFGTNSGVIILAATNRADILDKALLRAGRFDRQIHVDLPDLPERVAVFKVHLRPLKADPNLDVEYLARQTPGFSGADIANVCNEAALIAARRNLNMVGKQEFLDAVDRIIGGLEKKTKIMTDAEKRVIALHEAGHASVSWLLEHANPLVKVTIVPRGQALGAAWYLPEERTITTKEQMLDELCSLLAGRAAEQLCTGHISSGALNDLERATKSSYGMVAYLGMSDELSNLCYYDNQEYNFQKPYSEKTAERIDAEVHRIINEQYERAKRLLTEHKDEHARLAQLLVDREVIFREDVEAIFGPRPWKSRGDQLLEEQEAHRRKMAEEMAAKRAEEKAQQAAFAQVEEPPTQTPPPPPVASAAPMEDVQSADATTSTETTTHPQDEQPS